MRSVRAASPHASPAARSTPGNGSDGAAGWCSWLLVYRRLGVRYERWPDLRQKLLHLACTLICLSFRTREADEKDSAIKTFACCRVAF